MGGWGVEIVLHPPLVGLGVIKQLLRHPHDSLICGISGEKKSRWGSPVDYLKVLQVFILLRLKFVYA
jgi:hypothetical protein